MVEQYVWLALVTLAGRYKTDGLICGSSRRCVPLFVMARRGRGAGGSWENTSESTETRNGLDQNLPVGCLPILCIVRLYPPSHVCLSVLIL